MDLRGSAGKQDKQMKTHIRHSDFTDIIQQIIDFRGSKCIGIMEVPLKTLILTEGQKNLEIIFIKIQDHQDNSTNFDRE